MLAKTFILPNLNRVDHFDERNLFFLNLTKFLVLPNHNKVFNFS